jgi:hypothetical protein
LLTTARSSHTATLLPNGKVLVAGGESGGSSAELYDVGLGFSAYWQPQIATFTSPLGLGSSVVLTGSQFRGISEGSGGNSRDSPGDYPVVQLLSLVNEQTVFVLPTNWSTSLFRSAPVTGFPGGYALATVFVNGIPSTSSILRFVSNPPSCPPHPADVNGDYHVSGSEQTVFRNCWLQACAWSNLPISAVEASSSRYLWKESVTGAYVCDPSEQPPRCWVPVGTPSGKYQARTGSAIRHLPQVYSRSIPVLVSITVTSDAATTEFAVADYPPAEWTVANITGNGVWDSLYKRVKWGSARSTDSVVLTYQAIPPPGEYGAKIFAGDAGFDTTPVQIGGASSIVLDSVGDGIPDWWRQTYFGGDGTSTNNLSCATCDTVGTGQNNLFKYTAGLDPTSSASIFVLKIDPVLNQPIQKNLLFNPVVSGRTYTPEFSTDLTLGGWSPLTGYAGPETNGNQATITDLNAIEPQKFYRIRISLP